ncbi:hypothetical protein [uncultured Paraglaciecola sp.]|uniref:hypothetical protein n=1 Tax=uncultured Paraglaciecola sp. TaxID=1765024 RepID=UPI0026142001|nr:hypothetical protein [uncultured Paraglaciecola sp.]
MPRVRIGTSKIDGSLWAEQPNGELVSITESQADQIRNDPGVIGNFLESAGNQAQQLLLGAGQLLPGSEDYTERLQAARQAQEARGMVSPIAAGLGQAAPFVAAGIGSGALGAAAGGLRGAIGATVGTEAALGAADNPDNPIQGAAIGAGIGALPFVAGAAVQRMSGRVLQNIDRASATAPVRASADDIGDFVASAQREGLRVPLSVRTQSNTLQDVSLGVQSNPLLAPLAQGAQRHNAKQLLARANEAMGLDANRILTPQVMREASSRTSSEFKRLAQSQGPVMSKQEIVDTISSEIGESFVGKQQVLKQVNKLLKDFKSDDLTTDNLMRLQSSLGDLGRKGKLGKGESAIEIGKARDAIIDAIPANAGDEEAFKIARQQWAAQRAVEDSLGVRGELSAKKLAKRILTRDGDAPISKLGRTAEAMKFMSDSKFGTENSVRGGLTGALLPPVGIGAGAYGLFSN